MAGAAGLARSHGASASTSEQTGALVGAEIRRFVEEAHGTAQSALRTHEPALHRLAAALREHEGVQREQIEAIITQTASGNGAGGDAAQKAALGT